MVTILDVAREANVSASTVSRVMNNTGTISEETTAKVMKAARRLGYEPNMLARSFRRQETRIILVLVPNITNPYYTHIIAGISDTSRRLGYSSFLCNTQGDAVQEKETLDMLAKRRADGAILLATALGSDWLKNYVGRYPLVQCSEYDPDIKIPHVVIDNYQAARDVVHYLVDMGHRRIGLVSSENNYISTRLRQKGYHDELEAAGIPLADGYIRKASADYSFESGQRAARQLLEMKDGPTALFCISDVLAQGAIAAAQELKREVPGDVTVVGFDDVEQTMRSHPHITTLAQPCFEIGAKATELLCEFIANPKADELSIVRRRYEFRLPHKLIERESSAAPRRKT